MHPTKRLAVVDYELAYDVWSLLFCVLRMDEPNLSN